MLEARLVSLIGTLIQSSKGTRSIYFLLTTMVHKLFSEITLHMDFVAKAKENLFSCLMPHPPHSLGFAIELQATHGRNFLSSFLDQRKLLQMLLILLRMPMGTHAKLIQYTGIASRTDLIRTSLPALESHL